jgi:nifR3 family TIM-barrel protein
MNKNFWTDLYLKKKNLKEPIIVLAPMADVTDYVFRSLIKEKSLFGTEQSNLDVFWTEFVSVNGLSDHRGREALVKDLRYDPSEQPIVAQIFGEDPEKYSQVAKLCQNLGFAGVDINMGCPDKNVLGQKAGSYLINIPDIAKQIVEETKLGADHIPVTVKTRIGYNNIEWREWLGEILQTKPQVITIHLRTKKEMSLVAAHWELAPEIVKWIRTNFGTVEEGGPIIIFNGDVKDCDEAKQKWRESGCDGVMIGRGIFGNPWLFNKKIKKENLALSEILLTAVEHAKRFEKEISFKSFSIMKKHFKAYVNGFPGAKELRMKLMEAKNANEVEKIIKNWLFWYRIKKMLYWR